MAVRIVIPARYASTRLPAKPLALIAGVPMIVRVAQQALKSMADSVVVAVDDRRVFDVVAEHGFNVRMTSEHHMSGSDRVMEVAEQMGWPDDDIVVNIQGDEPLMPSAVVNDLCHRMQDQTDVAMATLSEPLHSEADFLNPNVVKVVVSEASKALYFSRAPIPYPRDHMFDGQLAPGSLLATPSLPVLRHIGLYGFRVSGLRTFVGLGESVLERIERLEQLRWLEAGNSLLVVPTLEAVPGGIDTPEDLARIQALFE